ncbi:protein ABHD15 [Hippoglossus hippoglossus]|uniref:protein ABHD15 n=1 Tax=Hippoglossus hippoglossus TaxID=8267 RepID=UPI00148BD926|nr:protein ABHD15 [Hippoglossus hippoglossus]
MAPFVWDCLSCLLPSLFLFLLSLVLRWLRARCRTGRASMTEEEPTLICKTSALAKYLLRHCGSLARPRPAAWPRGDPHLQTLSALLCGPAGDTVEFTRDNLLLRDGGIVAVDWALETGLAERIGRGRWEGRKEHQSGGKALGCFTSTPPVLLLIPHSWGGVSPHLKALCHQAIRQGFDVVVFHPRATAGCPLTTARLTEFGDPADLEQAVTYIHSRHPSSELVAVSEGSGSGVLLSYLGECGSSTYLTAAAAISPVLLGQLWFQTAMPAIYRWGALFNRKLQLRRYANSFRGVVDVDRALSSSSLRDFEEALFCSSAQHPEKPPVNSLNSSGLRSRPHYEREVAPSAAWALGERAQPAEDWDSYWERNEPLRDADEVAVPVLCICSRDDPLLPPASTLPIALFQSNPHFFLVLTDKGGHCGFTRDRQEMEGGKGENKEVEEGSWSHIAVLEYFRVVADFLRGERRDGTSWGGPLGGNIQAGQRNRGSTMAPLRRRRAAVMRRPRPQAPEQSSVDAEGENFTWKRSYTR